MKKTDIDLIQEMIALVEKGMSSTKAFVNTRHLHSVHNLKTFITSHLHTGQDVVVDITFPHHFSFYMANEEPNVDERYYSKDAWKPIEGTSCLKSLPHTDEVPKFVPHSQELTHYTTSLHTKNGAYSVYSI